MLQQILIGQETQTIRQVVIKQFNQLFSFWGQTQSVPKWVIIAGKLCVHNYNMFGMSKKEVICKLWWQSFILSLRFVFSSK